MQASFLVYGWEVSKLLLVFLLYCIWCPVMIVPLLIFASFNSIVAFKLSILFSDTWNQGARFQNHVATEVLWFVHLAILFTTGGFPGGPDDEESACNAGDLGLIPRSGRSPRKGMATHSGIVAWRIPWTEEPGGLQSIELQRVRRDWVTETQMHSPWIPLSCLACERAV